MNDQQVVKCWNNSIPALRHKLRIAVAILGDSVALFASEKGKYTKDTVGQCIRGAIQCELQNSAPRDMTHDQKRAYVEAGLDVFVFKDFVKGASQIQKPPQCRPDQSLPPMAIASQEWLEVQKAAGYYGLTLCIWSSNDATEAACKKDLKYRSATLPLPQWNTPLVESPYFTNAVPCSSATSCCRARTWSF